MNDDTAAVAIALLVLLAGCAPSDARCKRYGEPRQGPTIARSKGRFPIYVERGLTVQECLEYETYDERRERLSHSSQTSSGYTSTITAEDQPRYWRPDQTPRGR